MSAPWILLDAVLRQIEGEVVAQPPERGGALLGPVGYPVVSHFLLDDDAHTTSTVYIPSAEITDRVAVMEGAGTLELKGVLHSHPGLDRLSQQDEISFGGLLDLNPRMARCFAPVATQRRAKGDHEVEVPSGKLSCYCIARTRGGDVVETAEWSTLPVLEVAEQVARQVGAERVEMIGPARTFGPLTIDVLVTDAVLSDVVLAFPLAFPLCPPAVLVDDTHTGASLVPVRWRPGEPAAAQLVSAITTARRRAMKAIALRTRR